MRDHSCSRASSNAAELQDAIGQTQICISAGQELPELAGTAMARGSLYDLSAHVRLTRGGVLMRQPASISRTVRSDYRRVLSVVTIVTALLSAVCPWAGPALAADATLRGVGAGQHITGNVEGISGEVSYFAGILHITIDGGPETDAYCVDVHSEISIGDTEPQIPPDYPCQVGYVLNNAYPQENRIGSRLLSDSSEAAAVQAAIWYFTDGFTVTGPPDVVDRTASIIDAAQLECDAVTLVPQSLTLSPPSATNYLPRDRTQTVIATLRATDGEVIPGYPVDIVVTGAAGPQTFHGLTDDNGLYAVSYENAFAVTGSDTITGSASFTVPVGLEFKLPGLQGMVLAGAPRTGKVSATVTRSWVPGECGDGIVNQVGEVCDDGNLIDGDGCDSNCTPTGCGNGIITVGEECDDGNLLSGDGCDANCMPTGCGNGIVTVGEECDDGNDVNGDECDTNCTRPRCGNGIVTSGEECDDGNSVNGDECDTNCTHPRCGNGIVDPQEQCDDGNTVDGDGCDVNCAVTGCGNGVVSAGEQCDDGNRVSGDGCDVNCTLTGCGNGIVTVGEECDDGNSDGGDACQPDCKLPRCGDGILDSGEQCDDGNVADGDGCSAICRLEEICRDLIDNDGNGLIDCEDPACACERIKKDPAAIVLNQGKPDVFRLHGLLIPLTAMDPSADGLRIIVTNANGVVFNSGLQPGDLKRVRNRFAFTDRTATTAQGRYSGIQKVRLTKQRGRYRLTLRAFGTLDSATLPVMTVQIVVGDDAFFNKGEWRRTRRGWKLDF
jgi:TQXA domain-containing protein